MTGTGSPPDILEMAYQRAVAHRLNESFVADNDLAEKIAFVSRCPGNRAGARLVLACCLAKIHQPEVDIRRPYTELADRSYSGRAYDEAYVTNFVNMHQLPCNPTTAFLTPALRTKPVTLEPGTEMGGRPRQLYEDMIALLDAVENGRLSADNLLAEAIRQLLLLKEQRRQRMESLLEELRQPPYAIPLSSEDIITLIQQQFASPGTSRLPVLVVAAAYQAATDYLGEMVLPLESHTAADEQTGALGDIEITLVDDDRIVTSYEMKMKRVTREDIDRALQKITSSGQRVDNYIFVTTDVIDDEVADYAGSLYRLTGGIEFVVLDCIGFLRHFLHLFHRLCLEFLETYQELVLNEPESAVRQELKELFLTLRRAAESSYAVED